MSAEDRVHDVYRSSFDEETQQQESKLIQFVQNNPLVPICKIVRRCSIVIRKSRDKGNLKGESKTKKKKKKKKTSPRHPLKPTLSPFPIRHRRRRLLNAWRPLGVP
jgi:hypothetical protein